MLGAVWRVPAWVRQAYADLLARFWLRPSALTLAAVLLAEGLVWSEGRLALPAGVRDWVFAGGLNGARTLLGTIAAATIGVAGTTFSITVAALTLASNQMGPRLLRNFTRDAGNQYALGAFLASFAYALTVLRTVRDLEDGQAFVPHLAVSVALVLSVVSIGVLMWFLHHIASSINVSQVVAMVHRDLSAGIDALPERGDTPPPHPIPEAAFADAAALRTAGSGYLRVLDDDKLAAWAAGHGALLRLHLRAGDFVFPAAVIGDVTPPELRREAEAVLAGAMSLGTSRSVEQDIEYAVRQLVEIALRALSPSLNDPFTAVAVLDHCGAALCALSGRELPCGVLAPEGRPCFERPATDYDGLLDAMFHMIRQSAAGSPAVLIRLVEVLAAVAAVERDPSRRAALARHGALAEAAGAAERDATARAALAQRMRRLRAVLA